MIFRTLFVVFVAAFYAFDTTVLAMGRPESVLATVLALGGWHLYVLYVAPAVSAVVVAIPMPRHKARPERP